MTAGMKREMILKQFAKEQSRLKREFQVKRALGVAREVGVRAVGGTIAITGFATKAVLLRTKAGRKLIERLEDQEKQVRLGRVQQEKKLQRFKQDIAKMAAKIKMKGSRPMLKFKK